MEEYIKVNGKIIKCVVKVHFNGVMGENIKVNIFKIKNKGLEFSIGQMGKNISDFGN